jgi:hypothetical protein
MANHRPEYVDPKPVAPSRVLVLLESCGEETGELQEALVALALHEPDLTSAYEIIVRAGRDARPQVRATAILCLGHLARIHGTLPDDEVVSIITAGLQDEDELVRGQSENAASDLEVFLPELAQRIGTT